MHARAASIVLVLALLIAPQPARAAATPDSLAAPATTPVQVIGGTVVKPATAPKDTARKRPWHEQPRFVMARSLLVPGWGQEHNHAWLKAVLVASAEGLLGVRIVQDQRALDGLLRDIDLAKADEAAGLADADPVRVAAAQARRFDLTNEYNSRLDQRLGRQWLLGAVVAYAMVDAYVDANFRGFDVEFGKDPALPAGSTSALPSGGGSGPGMRLALRWNF